MRSRPAALVGLLTSVPLALAVSLGLLPQAVAGAGAPGSELTWTPSTPDLLNPGDTATAAVTFTAESSTGVTDSVLSFQLANAEAGPLPLKCRTAAVTPVSSVSADGLRLLCNLGPLEPGQVVRFDVAMTAGAGASTLAIQAGPYDDQGTVLTHPVDGILPTDYYRLLSSPDFLNADVADLRDSRWATWKPGQPNSWDSTYARMLDKILSDWAAFQPNAVTVPGDLVNGRWMKDLDDIGAFGPVDTKAHRKQSIRRAANTYFTAWRQRFTDHGLHVFAGIGDHDLGDNPWSGNKIMDEKREDAPLFRSLFEKYFTTKANGSYKYASRPVGTTWEGTSYSVRPNPEVELVMLDVFRSITGDTVAELAPSQYDWLEGVLAKAQRDGVDWIVVEGHTPIVGPVRRGPSSGLMYKGGAESDLWQLFQQYGVDVYLSGEVHASTAIVRDGIVQLSHGGNVGYGTGSSSRGGTSFVVSDFSAGGLVMKLYSWEREHAGGTLWQMAGNRIPEFQRFVSDPVEIGSVTISNNGPSSDNSTVVLQRSGLLDLFDPAVEPGPYSQEWLA